MGIVRRESRDLRARGWKLGSSSLVRRGAQGEWGHIRFHAPRWEGPPMRVDTYAGVTSPYLMRVLDRLDPTKPPPPDFVASHAFVLWQYALTFEPEASQEPAPLKLPVRPSQEPDVILTPETAGPWLRSALRLVAPKVEGLCDERAIRDWLLAYANAENYSDLRKAALLTRHLGLPDELPPILERAEAAKAAMDAYFVSIGMRPLNAERGTRHIGDWSHRHFLEFLEEAPP
jgi:hypothetical protein